MMAVMNRDRVSVSETAGEATRGKMRVDDHAEKKWREKSVEGDDGLRTLECLRGRLLAERTASKAAKEEAELMRNKLVELERKVKAEIEAKNRAEKKLKFLTKKLKCLKLAPSSDQSSSLEASSGLKDPEEGKANSEIAASVKCDGEEETNEKKEASISADPSHDGSVAGTSNEAKMNWREGSSGSVVTDPEELGNVDYRVSSKELVIADDLRLRDSSKESENGERDPTEDVDNSLAIVPVSTPTTPHQSREPEPPQIINSDDVMDVLAALRHAREKLHSYIGTRNGNHGFQCRSFELCGGV
ncbi:uncharacterized protein LOC122085966 [Macadamia integrifolia]|uniref:uncharacterized protein LOC122085966 n=1 Tax=Macadamia integrifolia TaxID=60698 RepID=UPI001C4FC5C9|nr:uncharacterized protein LOC122085966 [Macadamia integrifolia]